MGMDRPLPFTSTFNSLNSFLESYDIDLEKWCEMVLQFNSRSQVLLTRLRGERQLEIRNAVWWVTLGVLMGVGMLFLIWRAVVGLCSWAGRKKTEKVEFGKENEKDSFPVEDVKRDDVKKDEIVAGNGDATVEKTTKARDERKVLANGDGTVSKPTLRKKESEVLVNGNGSATKSPESKNDTEKQALREGIQVAKTEIERLMMELQLARQENKKLAPLREEGDKLRSQIELLSKGARHQEQDREVLEKRIQESNLECEKLREAIERRDLEICKLQPFKSEANELRFHLESCRAQLEAKEKAEKSLRTGKEKVEQDLNSCKAQLEEKDKAMDSLRTGKERLEQELDEAYKKTETVANRAAESYEIETKFRAENSELTKQMSGLVSKNQRVMKTIQDNHEKDMSKQQLAHEQEKQELKDEYEAKIKDLEAKERTRQRPESVASSSFTEQDSPGRLTPTRLMASIKRHSRTSRSSLPRSISGSFKSVDGKEKRGVR